MERIEGKKWAKKAVWRELRREQRGEQIPLKYNELYELATPLTE